MENINGESWRNSVKEQLSDRGIIFFDPYHKPFIYDVPEDENSRKEMSHWRETEQYDILAQRMRSVRGYDLRLCDICDFFIVNINPKIASWGSAEEIVTVIRQKKPVFLSIDDPLGKKACPLWLFGVLPHKYIYDNVAQVINCIKAIDDGIIKLNSDRWKLLKPELR